MTKQKQKTSCKNILFNYSLPVVDFVMLKKKRTTSFLIQPTSNKLILFEIKVNRQRKTKVTEFKKKKIPYSSKTFVSL